jgi:hypothetical protein
MPITVASPPPRQTPNEFEISDVHLSAGALEVTVQVRTTGKSFAAYTLQVRQGSGSGLRYSDTGEVERFGREGADITLGGAFNSFASQAGGFGARAAALEAWLQSRQLLPT